MKSSSRNKAKVRVLAVHTTEGIMRAADLRAWTSWPGSSHAAADETGVLLAGARDGFVDYEQASWTLRNGNPWSENIELCGFAKWKRGDWLARPKLLDACARWLGERAVARGIPLVKLSPKEYAAGRAGVIGHHDHTVGYSDGTHWDPGPDFPYDVVLAKASAYANGQTPPPQSEEDDMFEPADRALLRTIGDRLRGDTTFNNDSLQRTLDKLDGIIGILVGARPADAQGRDRLADLWLQENEQAAGIHAVLDEIRADLAKLKPAP